MAAAAPAILAGKRESSRVDEEREDKIEERENNTGKNTEKTMPCCVTRRRSQTLELTDRVWSAFR